ncbi:alpha/beta hydrolase family protein [Deinococcus apachensis]|uniref:alpha/beta hydrolase family protein n=1 Tax=Deinococcus apachensis TaxID=309886 RepID=UPI00036C3ABA|nr:alpha/beta hydrolase [Deinococcus apachensis]
MRLAPLFLLCTLLAALPVTARAAASIPATPPAWVLPLPRAADTVRLDRISGPSFLRVPPECYRRECALVIVSHPRGQSGERLHASPFVGSLVDALLAAPFAVLLSNDGGPYTWGSPAALEQVAGLREEAVSNFAWNGRTYALGLSMGGLLALRSALPGSPYRVSGVALIDAWADLEGAWNTGDGRRTEVEDAYGSGSNLATLNPLPLLRARSPLPLFVVASPDDKVVPMGSNGEPLFTHAEPGVSEFVKVSGPHLGGNRFSPTVARHLAAFFERLEVRAQEQARR